MRPTTILLLTFLGYSLSSPHGGEAAPDRIYARKLINSQGCKACHPLDGVGGTLATELRPTNKLFTPAEIRRQIINPRREHGDGSIPDFRHLRPEEVDALVEFLSSRE